METFIMKCLVTFAYGNTTRDYVTEVSCETYTEYSCGNEYKYISANTSTDEANNVNFYSEKVEANNDKKLITLVKEVEENCRQQNKYLDWIKLVGITPILNEEIEEVIDSFSNIND